MRKPLLLLLALQLAVVVQPSFACSQGQDSPARAMASLDSPHAHAGCHSASPDHPACPAHGQAGDCCTGTACGGCCTVLHAAVPAIAWVANQAIAQAVAGPPSAGALLARPGPLLRPPIA